MLAGSLAIAIGLLVLARRRPEGWWSDPGRAAGVLGAARSPFAVILAFVILVAFQAFNDAKQSAEEEATATRTLFKVAELLEPNRRAQLQENVLCYARGVVALDWPAMRDGESAREVDANAGELEDILAVAHFDMNGASAGEIQPILDDANDRDRARADRISEGQGQIPGPVWIVLGIGSVAVLAYVILFADPRERLLSQAVMVGSTTLIVVGGMVLVWFLSNPYRDQMGSIKPSAMERTLAELEDDPEFSVPGLTAPCDSKGRPLAPHEVPPPSAD